MCREEVEREGDCRGINGLYDDDYDDGVLYCYIQYCYDNCIRCFGVFLLIFFFF